MARRKKQPKKISSALKPRRRNRLTSEPLGKEAKLYRERIQAEIESQQPDEIMPTSPVELGEIRPRRGKKSTQAQILETLEEIEQKL